MRIRWAWAWACAALWLCACAADERRAAAERQLLGLLGLERRPRPRPGAAAVDVPPAMRALYERTAAKPGAALAALSAAHPHDANTVRSYTHQTSVIDDRFPNHHHFRLYFNVSGVPADEERRGASVILQRTSDAHLAPRQRLLLYDVMRPGRRAAGTQPIMRLIDSLEVHPGDGAIVVDATLAAERWAVEPGHNHGLLVRVLEEDRGASRARVRVRRRAAEDEKTWRALQPVLMLYTEDERAREARSRRRRSTPRRAHRRKDTREACRRRPLFVDFADVGWSDWIVAPHGYDAYYCHGDCPFPLADHLNGTNHAIVQTLVNSVDPAAVPKACCVPTQLSSISMLYLDEDNKVVLKNYQDMAVVGCGCR